MSAIEKAAAMLRQEAEGLKASHTLRGDWCGDPAEADYHEMIAVANAAISERDSLRAALQHEADCVEAAKAEIDALRAELAGLRSSMEFRTSLIGRTEAERDAMRAKLEATEEDRSRFLVEMGRLCAQCDALRAKVERMEQQEPVRHEFQGQDGAWYPFINQRQYENTVADGTWPIRALYALPGAKGEQS